MRCIFVIHGIHVSGWYVYTFQLGSIFYSCRNKTSFRQFTRICLPLMFYLSDFRQKCQKNGVHKIIIETQRKRLILSRVLPAAPKKLAYSLSCAWHTQKKRTASQLIMSMCLHFNFAWNYARISDNNTSFSLSSFLPKHKQQFRYAKMFPALFRAWPKPLPFVMQPQPNQNPAPSSTLNGMNIIFGYSCYFIAGSQLNGWCTYGCAV